MKHMVLYHRRSFQRNVYTMHILQVDICTDRRDIHYYTRWVEQIIMARYLWKCQTNTSPVFSGTFLFLYAWRHFGILESHLARNPLVKSFLHSWPCSRQMFQLGLAAVDIALVCIGATARTMLGHELHYFLIYSVTQVLLLLKAPMQQSNSSSLLGKVLQESGEMKRMVEVLRSSENNWQRCPRGNLLEVWTGVSLRQWTRN